MAETVVRVRRGQALGVLARRVDALEAAEDISASRARQLRMVVGMWRLALERWPADAPVPGPAAADLFGDRVLETFWDLAAAGRLRTRAQDVGRPLPGATLRVVRDCLGILAEQVVPGRAVWLPSVPQQEAKTPARRGQLPVLFRTLVDLASDAPVERDGASLSERDRVRLLAMVVVVLDTGAHSGELESMRLADLGDGEGSVLVRRQPQNGAHRPHEERCPLREGTGVALRRWLRVRADLVAESLSGGDPGAVWVSLRPNQWQPTAGLPLRAQGIRHAYARGMGLLNRLMAGEYGWEPMPTTLEQLRRAVAEPGPVPGQDAFAGQAGGPVGEQGPDDSGLPSGAAARRRGALV